MQKRPRDDDSDDEQRTANLARTQAGSPRSHSELDHTPPDIAKPDTEEMPRPQSPSIFSAADSKSDPEPHSDPEAPLPSTTADCIKGGASGAAHRHCVQCDRTEKLRRLHNPQAPHELTSYCGCGAGAYCDTCWMSTFDRLGLYTRKPRTRPAPHIDGAPWITCPGCRNRSPKIYILCLRCKRTDEQCSCLCLFCLRDHRTCTCTSCTRCDSKRVASKPALCPGSRSNCACVSSDESICMQCFIDTCCHECHEHYTDWTSIDCAGLCGEGVEPTECKLCAFPHCTKADPSYCWPGCEWGVPLTRTQTAPSFDAQQPTELGPHDDPRAGDSPGPDRCPRSDCRAPLWNEQFTRELREGLVTPCHTCEVRLGFIAERELIDNLQPASDKDDGSTCCYCAKPIPPDAQLPPCPATTRSYGKPCSCFDHGLTICRRCYFEICCKVCHRKYDNDEAWSISPPCSKCGFGHTQQLCKRCKCFACPQTVVGKCEECSRRQRGTTTPRLTIGTASSSDL